MPLVLNLLGYSFESFICFITRRSSGISSCHHTGLWSPPFLNWYPRCDSAIETLLEYLPGFYTGTSRFVWFSDVDECADSSVNDCQQLCINAAGSFLCDCLSGYQLAQDGTTCQSNRPLPDPIDYKMQWYLVIKSRSALRHTCGNTDLYCGMVVLYIFLGPISPVVIYW